MKMMINISQILLTAHFMIPLRHVRHVWAIMKCRVRISMVTWILTMIASVKTSTASEKRNKCWGTFFHPNVQVWVMAPSI